MAVAARALMDAGLDGVERDEAALTAYAFDRLRRLPGITIYGGQLNITGKADPRTIGAAGLERFVAMLGEQLSARAAGRS